MGGGDQLLGIGARLALEARAEGVGRVVERAGIGRDMALPVLAEAFVARGSVAGDHQPVLPGPAELGRTKDSLGRKARGRKSGARREGRGISGVLQVGA